MKNTVFVSYSHKDKRYFEELKIHLEMLQKYNGVQVEVWTDQEIRPGNKWKREIFQALLRSRIAVLLVSQNFLVSKFILNEELPVLLKKAREGELVILGIVIKPVLLDNTPIEEYHLFNTPQNPLAMYSPTKRGMVWVNLCSRIKEIATESSHFKQCQKPLLISEIVETDQKYFDSGKAHADSFKNKSEQDEMLQEDMNLLISSIKEGYPDMQDNEAEKYAREVISFIAAGIEEGDRIAFWGENEEGGEVIDYLDINEIEDVDKSEE